MYYMPEDDSKEIHSVRPNIFFLKVLLGIITKPILTELNHYIYSIPMNCIFKRQIILISVLLYNRRQKKEEGESKKLYQKHLFRRQQRIEATISDRQTASEAEE